MPMTSHLLLSAPAQSRPQDRTPQMQQGKIMDKAHPPLRQKATGQFREEPFITYSSDPQLRDLQLAALSHFGVVPQRMYAADSSETILGFVAAGIGYSLLASLLPRGPKVPGVVAQPLTEPAREFPIYVAWRKSTQRNPLIDALLGLAPKP